MTKLLTQKDQVAIYVRHRPNCDIREVAEALDMASTTAGKHLRNLSVEGVINRIHNGTQYCYTAAPGASIPEVVLPCMLLKSDPAKILAAEERAKALEGKGLWRRAATAYSDMLPIVCSSLEVARIAQRRDECLRNARRV